jgi:hypothetical protein
METEKDNTEKQNELDQDMDDAFMAAAEELGIETGVDDEEREELQGRKEGSQEGQEEVLDSPESSAQGSDGAELLETDEEPEPERMPQSWKKEDAKIWQKLTPDAKARVRQREMELTRLVTQKASQFENAAAPIRSMLEEIEPVAKTWRMQGKTREQGILQAVALFEHIRTGDKVELAKQFLKASGKGPEALIDTPVSARDRELQELREKVNRLESGVSEYEAERQVAPIKQFVQASEREFGAFRETKNAFGGIKYPSTQNPEFARALGSLVTRLAGEVPDAQPSQLIQLAYERLGGQIDNGNIKPRLSNTNNSAETLKTQARSGFGKGKTLSQQKVKYDNTDDAWQATLSEFGLLE